MNTYYFEFPITLSIPDDDEAFDLFNDFKYSALEHGANAYALDYCYLGHVVFKIEAESQDDARTKAIDIINNFSRNHRYANPAFLKEEDLAVEIRTEANETDEMYFEDEG